MTRASCENTLTVLVLLGVTVPTGTTGSLLVNSPDPRDIEISMFDAYQRMMECMRTAEHNRDNWFQGKREAAEAGKDEFYWLQSVFAKGFLEDNRWYMQQAIMYAAVVKASGAILNVLNRP